MPGCRAALHRPTMERLEGRGLLSVLAPTPSAESDVAAVDRGAAEVASSESAANRDGDRITSIGTTRDAGDDSAHTTRSDDGTVLSPSLGDRNNLDAIGSIKRSAGENAEMRELEDALFSVMRVRDLVLTTEPTDDLPATGSEPTSVNAGGAAGDPAGLASALGWAPATAMPAITAPNNPPSLVVGIDARTGLGPQASATVTASPVSAVEVVLGSEIPGMALWTMPRTPDDQANESSQPSVSATMAGEAPATSWGDLLEGALPSDWDGIEGQLRRFLSRLGGLADAADGRGAGLSWHLWIGTATALILARRAAWGPQRWFRRPAPETIGLSAHRPVPEGPWPLGPP
jgi:hypothetical protein